MIPKQYAHIPTPEGAEYYTKGSDQHYPYWYKLEEGQWYAFNMDPDSGQHYWSAIAGITQPLIALPKHTGQKAEILRVIDDYLEELKLKRGVLIIPEYEISDIHTEDGQTLRFTVTTTNPELASRLAPFAVKAG